MAKGKAEAAGFDRAKFTPDRDRYREQYGVIVLCDDEADQERIYERLKGLGLACRVVVT